MARRHAQGDIAVIVQDMRRGLAEWWDAVRTLGGNPVLAVLRRRESGGHRRAGSVLFGQLHSAMALLFALYVLLDQLNRWHTLDQPRPVLMRLLLVAFGIYVLVLGNGLYRVAADALALISRAESGRLVRVQLDETMLASRISERELTVALAASLLPRLWLAWLTAPLMAPLAFALFALWTQPREGQRSILPSFIYYGTGLKHLLSRVPEAAAVLLVLGLLSSVLLLLWLIAVGRSLRHPWQIELTALTVTAAQLAWVPAAYYSCFNWITFGQPGEIVLIPVPFATLLAVALVVATLHYTRHQPMSRTLIAAAGPLLVTLALILVTICDVLMINEVRVFPGLQFPHNIVWSFGPFALVNPLGLPSPTWAGIPSGAFRENYCAFQLFRLPLLLVLLAAYSAICAHAARLAIFDWRYSED